MFIKVVGTIPTMNHYLSRESNLQPHALKLMLSTVRPGRLPKLGVDDVPGLQRFYVEDLLQRASGRRWSKVLNGETSVG